MANNSSDTQMWLAIIQMLTQTQDIKVPPEFHTRCVQIQKMLASDTTGMINSILGYAISSASEVKYKIKADNNNITKELNDWLKDINASYRSKIPTGLRPLAQEYFRERLLGSSLCVLKVHFPTPNENSTDLILPDYLYFVDGSAVYINNPEGDDIVSLGEYTYYLGKPILTTEETPSPNELKSDANIEIMVTKPFERWHIKYPSPYLIRNGVLRNFMALEILKKKGDDVIKRLLPYILQLQRGSDTMLQKGIKLDDGAMTTLQTNFAAYLKNFETNYNEVPLYTSPYDAKLTHVIPDITNIVKRDLFTQGERAILYGLGFVEVIMGSSRQETILNPKPFIQEVVNSVEDFKTILIDLIALIIEKNIENHRKYFSKKNSFQVIRTPVRIDIAQVMDSIRQGFIYGDISHTTYQYALGVDPEEENALRKYEAEEGIDELLYPHIIQNVEDKGIDIPLTKKQVEKTNEKQQMKATDESVMAPYNKPADLPPAVKDNMDESLQKVFIKVFNKALQHYKDDTTAIKVAWSVIKKIAKKGDDGKWHQLKGSKQDKFIDKVIAKLDEMIKSSSVNDLDEMIKIKKLEIMEKKEKVLDALLKGENKNETLPG
jgi:cation transport regulator ChaB